MGSSEKKMGSFSQGRSKTTAPKGCHELIPFPSDLLLLCVPGVGWGPGKTLNPFLVLEAMCAVVIVLLVGICSERINIADPRELPLKRTACKINF